jgi:hypothetical protein
MYLTHLASRLRVLSRHCLSQSQKLEEGAYERSM